VSERAPLQFAPLLPQISIPPCSGDEDPAEAAGAAADPFPAASAAAGLRSVPAARKPTALAPAKGGKLQAQGGVAPASPKCGSWRRALPAGEARLATALASAAGIHGAYIPTVNFPLHLRGWCSQIYPADLVPFSLWQGDNVVGRSDNSPGLDRGGGGAQRQAADGHALHGHRRYVIQRRLPR
jgi:hypothetical protein